MTLWIILLTLVSALPGCTGGSNGMGFQPGPVSVAPAAAAVTATFSAPSVNQTVPGRVGAELGTVRLDAADASTLSTVAGLEFSLFTFGGAKVTDVTNLQIFDGTTPLNTGSAVANPSTTQVIVPFDEFEPQRNLLGRDLVIRGNIAAGVPVGANFGLRLNGVTAFAPDGRELRVHVPTTGVVGSTITVVETVTSISRNAGSPNYQLVATGFEGVTNVRSLVVNLRSSGEATAFNILELALLDGPAASVMQATVYTTGGLQIASATFTGASTHATATLAEFFQSPRDQDTPVIVNLSLTGIGTNQPGRSGEFIRVAVVGARGFGLETGKTVTAIGRAEAEGFRTYRSVPRVALDHLTASGVVDGRLLRFKITAGEKGTSGLGEFSAEINPDGCEVTNVGAIAFTDSAYSSIVPNVENGRLAAVRVPGTNRYRFRAVDSSLLTTSVILPQTQSRYIEIRGSVIPMGTNYSVNTTLLGDTEPIPASGMGYLPEITSRLGGRFVWSPHSRGEVSHPLTHQDWTNGFSLPGLPSNGLLQTRTN